MHLKYYTKTGTANRDRKHTNVNVTQETIPQKPNFINWMSGNVWSLKNNNVISSLGVETLASHKSGITWKLYTSTFGYILQHNDT